MAKSTRHFPPPRADRKLSVFLADGYTNFNDRREQHFITCFSTRQAREIMNKAFPDGLKYLKITWIAGLK